jgi:coenzyme F420-reducing hydrogenase gamma subunit
MAHRPDRRPRVAFFDFACCEGCQLTVLSIGEPLIALLASVEVVQWREAISEKSDDFDIAVVEGAITRDSDVPRLKRIRERAKTLIALGACATIGGPHVSANRWPTQELLSLVYGEKAAQFEAGEVRPLSAEVKVDIPIYGCPINADEFLTVMKHTLIGRPYRPPAKAVCYECKLNGYECVYDKGMLCLGPVTRCGCNAICTSRGHRCFGCRGLVDDPNTSAAFEVLEEHGKTLEEVVGLFEIYSIRAPRVRELAEAAPHRAKPEKAPEPWRFGSNT